MNIPVLWGMNLKTKKAQTLFMSAIIGALALGGCKKEIAPVKLEGEWEPVIAIPLAYSNFDVYDILEYSDSSETVQIDEDGQLALAYSGNILSMSFADYITIEDQNISDARVLTVAESAGIASVGQVFWSQDLTQSLNLENSGAKVTAVHILESDLNISATSDIGADVGLTITIGNLINNANQAFTATIALDATNSSQTDASSNDLSDYRFVFDPLASDPYQMQITVETTISEAPGFSASSGESLALNIDMLDFQFERVEGNIGQQSLLEGSDSLSMDIFSNAFTGILELASPRMTLNVFNSIGAPISLMPNDVYTLNTNTGSTNSYISNEVFEINYPTEPSMGTQTTSLVIDAQTNPDFTLLFEPAPQVLITELSAAAHPEGDTLSFNDFVSHDAELAVDIDLNLPLHGRLENLMFRDTIDFNSNTSTEGYDQIQWAEFRTVTNNGFPFNLELQLYFLDENNTVIDSLYNGIETLLAGASTDDDGRVDLPSKKITDTYTEKEKAESILNAPKAVIVARANTTGTEQGELIRIYDDYFLDLNFGVKFSAKEDIQ